MTGGKVDFALIREATRIDLVKLLDKLPGTKVSRVNYQIHLYIVYEWIWDITTDFLFPGDLRTKKGVFFITGSLSLIEERQIIFWY